MDVNDGCLADLTAINRLKKGLRQQSLGYNPKNDRKELEMINLIISMLRLVKSILELLSVILK